GAAGRVWAARRGNWRRRFGGCRNPRARWTGRVSGKVVPGSALMFCGRGANVIGPARVASWTLLFRPPPLRVSGSLNVTGPARLTSRSKPPVTVVPPAEEPRAETCAAGTWPAVTRVRPEWGLAP